jgi:hypothetical protein
MRVSPPGGYRMATPISWRVIIERDLGVPGGTRVIAIELNPTSNLFTSGHRLRLDISCSNFPHFDVNPNLGGPEGAMEHPRIARNQIRVDAAQPSDIVVPVIPLESVGLGGNDSLGSNRDDEVHDAEGDAAASSSARRRFGSDRDRGGRVGQFC